MPLPDGFPGKANLEKNGYDSVSEVSEATDEELLALEGIAEGTLAKIREVAPYNPSPSETGTGETSGKDFAGKGPDHSLEPTAQSYQNQTSGESKDQTDPTTGEALPKGIIKNVRGTMTASSTVDQVDMVSPKQLEEERKNRLRQMGERVAAALGE
jgi:hypothetical protein